MASVQNVGECMKENIYYHVDVNSAFLSWSAVKEKLNGSVVDYRDIPSVVGGDQEKRHGIVLAKSTPAKKYKIQTGEPLTDALRKCPDLAILQPDYDLYVGCSRALIQILSDVSPDIEQYSIDEAWVNMTGMEGLYGSPVIMAEQLKNRIFEELGFSVNIGVSRNKLLAKMASELRKPNFVHSLFTWEIKQKMWPLPVRELFYVGGRTEKKLHKLGIQTIGDLANSDVNVLKAHMKKHGEIIHRYANGGELEPFIASDAPNKGYGNSVTVPFDVTDRNTAHQVLLSLCETIGTRLRVDKVKISCVSVSIRTFDFQQAGQQAQLFSPTNTTEEIFRAACNVFDKFWDGRTSIRQVGVHTTKVNNSTARQYNLFDMDKYDRIEKLDEAVDNIRERYGEDAIMRACFLQSKLGHMAGGIDSGKRTGMTKPV